MPKTSKIMDEEALEEVGRLQLEIRHAMVTIEGQKSRIMELETAIGTLTVQKDAVDQRLKKARVELARLRVKRDKKR